MSNTKRPRVVAIGLSDTQMASIAPLCGELRQADSSEEYVENYSWIETDVMVSSALEHDGVDINVNVLTMGPTLISWPDFYRDKNKQLYHYADTYTENTERELTVPDSCPKQYKQLAAEMSRQLSRSEKPPTVFETSRKDCSALIETTSRHPVALRLVLPARSTSDDGASPRPVALLLPEVTNLAAWFRAFLFDVHESDPDRVPHAPPRLAQPSDWYTPQERDLTRRISQIDSNIERLTDERDQLQTELAAEGERADKGIRRILWADGDDLVAAAEKVLSGLGFKPRNIDLKRSEGEPKREDLRLTLPDRSGWEAIVEVKGYTSGTRTNDARQIREHRDHYIKENGRTPDLTVWLANPFRTLDPSSRPSPGQNVQESAANVGAVHVLAPDLYRQWTLTEAGSLDKETVVQSLAEAAPGLWIPPSAGSGTYLNQPQPPRRQPP